MNYLVVKKFYSKKNNVFLSELAENKVVVKIFVDKNNYKNELDVYGKLENDINCAKVINFADNTIVYEYIQGNTLLQMLDNESIDAEIVNKLLRWMKVFYDKTGLILYDAHLKNFIYNDEIYGIDFEQAVKGEKEYDIASLILFTVTYRPMFTLYKIRIAKLIYEVSLEILDIKEDAILSNLKVQMNLMQKRRNTKLMSSKEWDNLIHNLKL